MNSIPIRRPSAFVPLLMSLVAFGVVVAHVSVFGVAHDADEGGAAHLFQLLIAAQAPIIAYGAVTCAKRAPRQAMAVVAMQALAIGAALAPVWYFGL